MSDFPSHLPLLPWLQGQRMLMFEFHYLITVLDEVDEVNELPLKLQIGFQKKSEVAECAILSPGKRRQCLQ